MRKVVFEKFRTLDNFIDTMEQRPLNTAFTKAERTPTSQKDETENGGRFSGVNTYNDAAELMKIGYKEPLEKMKKAILKIGENNNYQRPRVKNDFVGFAPNVPNYLMNLPITMINREKQAAKAKTILLTYSFCAAAQTSTNDMIKGGINFISLVNSLEKQGYRIKIDILFASLVPKTAAAFSITVKEYDQQTNLLKLAFPLVHPAMLRRFAFKWLETTPNLKDQNFPNGGYGTPLNYAVSNDIRKEREFLENSDILKSENSYYCNVYTAMRAKNIEELAKKMNIVK